MIGMMNGGAVDVPAEFYGEGRPRGGTRKGTKKSDTRLFSKKQMLREKISYAKDGRMLINGRLAATNEVLTPSEMWEGLMMRVMCNAVCESYMKEPTPLPKKRLSDYFLPWRRRKRQGTAAANAIANAATAVSELQRTRKDSVSSAKSLKTLLKTVNESKSIHKSSTGSNNSKENELLSVPKASDNTSAYSSDSVSLRDVSKVLVADDHKTSASNGKNNVNRRSFFSSNTNINHSNNNLSVGKSNAKSSTDDVINSLAAKISAKITNTPSRNSTVTAEQPASIAARITRSFSSTSLKSPNALAKPSTPTSVQMRASPFRTRRPLSISALTSLTTRYCSRAVPRASIFNSQVAAKPTTHRSSINAPIGTHRPLHALPFNANTAVPVASSISSRFFNIGGSKISSTSSTISTVAKQHNQVYNKAY